ncbi:MULTISPECIES: ABC transporter substrate-binding protein [unclassified Mesorhizobium]|uniref:ABC transporter substrate-binding protein n=1 Tax=unclassified Mesorhizobium TaxID=325217 RepID=UPI0011269A44|nr:MULTISPECIES: ABC transporter substrate-binding protein [unclassified Mesorhizobium]MBZ9700548.1 ABC transporter substrate-binding protein [Mesorhizobium sp. CO1-1-3]MBZ9946484.1 ABC transporter substrate-binding protein [Mesorhizobium sp. BR1-1-11]TPI96525.1 ABC transporter substrate-binding protein [Mesorhizobium sp. B2-8-1]
MVNKNESRRRGPTFDRRTFLKSVGAAGALAATNRFSFAADEPVKGGHLVVGLAGGASTDSLDPTLSAAQAAGNMVKQLQENLICPASDGKGLEAMLAESWDYSKDLLKWNFKIRKGVTFHNGKLMTAKDVIYSLNRHRGPETKSGGAAGMRIVSDVKAENDHEVTITLNEPNVDFPYVLTDYHVVVQPEGLPVDSGIGTGVYALKEVNLGTRYITTKYKDYWREDVGFVDSIESLVINDATARISALLNGRVHLIDTIPPKIVPLIKGSKVATIVPTQGRAHYSLAMRCDAAPFDNADLRMALKLAIDREDLVRRILYGYGAAGNDTPINDAYPLATVLPQRKYDPEEAGRLYKKSGHSGPIDLHISDVAFPGAVDAATLYKEHAAKAGIDINVIRVPGDGYWTDIWLKKPFCGTFWDGRPTQDLALALAYKSDAPWNDTAWMRPEFDKLLAEARSTDDEAIRTAKYKLASEMIRDDGGAIIPMFNQYLDGVSHKVKGYVPDVNNELMNGRFFEKVWLE